MTAVSYSGFSFLKFDLVPPLTLLIRVNARRTLCHGREQ